MISWKLWHRHLNCFLEIILLLWPWCLVRSCSLHDFYEVLHSSHLKNTITVMLVLQMTTQEASRKSAGCFKTCVWYAFLGYDFIAASTHCCFQWDVSSCVKWCWTERQRTSTDCHSWTRFLRYNGKILWLILTVRKEKKTFEIQTLIFEK